MRNVRCKDDSVTVVLNIEKCEFKARKSKPKRASSETSESAFKKSKNNCNI